MNCPKCGIPLPTEDPEDSGLCGLCDHELYWSGGKRKLWATLSDLVKAAELIPVEDGGHDFCPGRLFLEALARAKEILE